MLIRCLTVGTYGTYENRVKNKLKGKSRLSGAAFAKGQAEYCNKGFEKA